MDVNGWIDSGHNFLVTRAGHILQGRWLTVSAIEAGQMVVSAHCPTQNTQIGIEHEHLGTEQMTSAQRDASAWLMAWIAGHYGHSAPLPVYPHRKYFNTACPANLAIRAAALKILRGGV
jgi:N-acetyl-anhydromuramyl-L-alanine amidase AmpD